MQVVPLRDLTAAELALHDGNDESRPLYLAIQGTVYNITKGAHFYGPGGRRLLCVCRYTLHSRIASACSAHLISNRALGASPLEALPVRVLFGKRIGRCSACGCSHVSDVSYVLFAPAWGCISGSLGLLVV